MYCPSAFGRAAERKQAWIQSALQRHADVQSGRKRTIGSLFQTEIAFDFVNLKGEAEPGDLKAALCFDEKKTAFEGFIKVFQEDAALLTEAHSKTLF
jgi:hypothetical protein